MKKQIFSIRPVKNGWKIFGQRIQKSTPTVFDTQLKAIRETEILGWENCEIKIFNRENKLRRYYSLSRVCYTLRLDIPKSKWK